MKFNKYIIFQWLVFLINPVLGFCISSYYLLKKRSSPIVMSMSLALIFIYFPLMYDTSSNFYLTNELKNINIQNYFDIRLYNLIPYYLFKSINQQFMFVIFLYTVVIFYIWFHIYNYYSSLSKDSNTLIYMSIFLFSSIIYRDIMDLNRFYLATSLILFVIFYLEIKSHNYKSSMYIYTLLIIAFLIHPATLILIIFYILSKIITNRSFYIMAPAVSFILGLISSPILHFLLTSSIFNNFELLSYAMGYISIDNEWGKVKIHGYELILRIIEIGLIILLYYKIIILSKIKNKNIFLQYISLLMGFVLFLLSYKTLYERYSIVFFLFSSILIYISILQRKKKDYILYSILSLYVLRFIFINIIWYGSIFTSKYNKILPNQDKKITMVYKPFYLPTFVLLDIKNYGYSNLYIQRESTRGRSFLIQDADFILDRLN